MNYSKIDVLLIRLSDLLSNNTEINDSPAVNIQETDLSNAEKNHIAKLMKVNLAGEVCANALYKGQALAAKNNETYNYLIDSSKEELDHLHWCKERIKQLGHKPSILNPLFYVASFNVGFLAGVINDKISLGFVAETERQVREHIYKHLDELPLKDKKTRAILEQMYLDEQKHQENANNRGAYLFAFPIRKAMRVLAKVMTETTKHI